MFGQLKMGSVVIFPTPAVPHDKVLRQEFFQNLAKQCLLSRWKSKLWPLVRWYNVAMVLKSERRYAVLHHAERVTRKLFGLRLKPLWSKLDGMLFCFCVNRKANELRQRLQA
jgi:hypothetical protein